MIAEGILLSVANSKRYVDEAQLLHISKSNQTSLLCLFLAAEELAKANLLLQHFSKGKDVPVEQVEKYFRDHKLKFEEFYRFLYAHSFLPMDLTTEKLDEMIKAKGFTEQHFKERIMYVDWTDGRWHNPLENADFAFATIPNSEEWLKSRIVDLALHLKGQIFNLEHGFDFPRVMAAPIIDVATEFKVWEILKEYVPPNTMARVKVSDKQILIKIHPAAPLYLKKELYTAITTRFVDYDVCIEISKKGVAMPW